MKYRFVILTIEFRFGGDNKLAVCSDNCGTIIKLNGNEINGGKKAWVGWKVSCRNQMTQDDYALLMFPTPCINPKSDADRDDRPNDDGEKRKYLVCRHPSIPTNFSNR